MSELDDIRSFVAVVESGGFGRAGQRLGLSKSIISRRVARLEAELGTRLLSRTTRGIAATEAGLEFKARGERILADLAEARDAVAQQAGGVVGRLRLSMPLTFGNRHVAPVLGELATRHPGLELAEVPVRLVSGAADQLVMWNLLYMASGDSSSKSKLSSRRARRAALSDEVLISSMSRAA